MKKLLIISPHLPWPLDSGGGVGVFYLLSYISNHLDVTFLSSYNRVNSYETISELQKRLPNVHFLLYDYRRHGGRTYEMVRKIEKRIDCRLKFGTGPYKNILNVTDLMTPGFIQYVNDIILERKINIVQVEFISYLPLVYALPKSVKKIFVHHELGFVRNELQFKDDVYSNYIKSFLKDNEISMCNHYDTVVALTQVDKEKLVNNGVVSNVVVSTLAISSVTQNYKHHEYSGKLTFIGGSSHSPNVDGLKWFAAEVLPVVYKNLPETKLKVIGKWSKQAIKEVSEIDPNIHFLGFVDDLAEALDNSLMVVPIRIGSGMRMKILEAANNSVPFVSTVIGAEGLVFKSGQDCFIADNANEMATRIITLCKDKELYERFSVNSHNCFVDNYSIEALGRIRLNLYDYENTILDIKL